MNDKEDIEHIGSVTSDTGRTFLFKKKSINSIEEIKRKLCYVFYDRRIYVKTYNAVQGDYIISFLEREVIYLKDILGLIHNPYGSAEIIVSTGMKFYYLNGVEYESKEDWFKQLTSEQRAIAIWDM